MPRSGSALSGSQTEIRIPDLPTKKQEEERPPLLVNALDSKGRDGMVPPMFIDKGRVCLRGWNQIPETIRRQIDAALSEHEVERTSADSPELGTDVFAIPMQSARGNMAKVIGSITKYEKPKAGSKNPLKRTAEIDLSRQLDFDDIKRRADHFSEEIVRKKDQLIAVLTTYETHEVAEDEIERSLDLLRNLDQNREYFVREVGTGASFLPRNQPLYALTCFGIVPSLMARDIDVRAPVCMRENDFFTSLTEALELGVYFPNIAVSNEDRTDFIEKHSRLVPDTVDTPMTDFVIFTGSPKNADRIREQLPNQVLVITNGSGHNPIVVAEDADIDGAVNAVLKVGFYNQGEDCASPDSILVHRNRSTEFLSALKEKMSKLKVGPYSDPDVQVGPMQGVNDLLDLQKLIAKDAKWLDSDFPGVSSIGEVMMYPTLIVKPLSDGPNFDESFGPVLVVQEYDEEKDLETYFQRPEYAMNAMYITTWGNSVFVNHFAQKSPLHTPASILSNTDLHAPGMELGWKPYGGRGAGASHVSINGVKTPGATLPQRDIYQALVEPHL